MESIVVSKIRHIVQKLQKENYKLKEQNNSLLENLKRCVDRLEENGMGQMSAVTRAKEAILKVQ